MSLECLVPVSDDDLLDYWTDTLEAGAAGQVEEHLFACGECSARLDRIAALGAGVATLVRSGRFAGIVSRSTLNRMQRDGVHVRTYTIDPGERVPCAAFPDDDLLVLALRVDFGGADAVTVSLARADDGVVVNHVTQVPVLPNEREILWATPGDAIRQMPSARMRVTVRSEGATPAVLAEYELDHTHLPA